MIIIKIFYFEIKFSYICFYKIILEYRDRNIFCENGEVLIYQENDSFKKVRVMILILEKVEFKEKIFFEIKWFI